MTNTERIIDHLAAHGVPKADAERFAASSSTGAVVRWRDDVGALGRSVARALRVETVVAWLDRRVRR